MALDTQVAVAVERQQRVVFSQVHLVATGASQWGIVSGVERVTTHGVRYAMLMLVAGSAQRKGILPKVVLVLGTVGSVAGCALLIAVRPGFDVLYEFAILGMAGQAEIDLLSLE